MGREVVMQLIKPPLLVPKQLEVFLQNWHVLSLTPRIRVGFGPGSGLGLAVTLRV